MAGGVRSAGHFRVARGRRVNALSGIALTADIRADSVALLFSLGAREFRYIERFPTGWNHLVD
jgi:hypothetical protein